MYKIKAINEDIKNEARGRWRSIAKPIGSLGVFEEIITQIAAIQGTLKPDIKKRCVIVMCADNGVVSEGVSQTDSTVTAIVAENIARGRATVCKCAAVAGADVIPVDVGMARDAAGTLKRKTSCGTKDIMRERAMTRGEARTAVQTGIDLAADAAARGHKIIVTGEMGIGNTTTASAVAAALLGADAAEVAGRGAGLSDEGLKRKIYVIERSLRLHKPDKTDALDVLSKVGGFDIAAMAGLFIGGAVSGVPVVIDGFISSAAALCASKLCAGCADFMIASHVSRESCAERILGVLGKKAPIEAGMFPGEGAGGVMLLPLLDMALAVYSGMPLFEETGIERYREFDKC